MTLHRGEGGPRQGRPLPPLLVPHPSASGARCRERRRTPGFCQGRIRGAAEHPAALGVRGGRAGGSRS